MRKILGSGFVVVLLGGLALGRAQDGPPMPKPEKEHQWLHHLVGEWDAEGECVMDPSKPPVKFKGTESGRTVGGFWIQLENKGEFLGAPFTGILSLGYDPEKKQYIGTWIDSMSSTLWHYTGTVDASGKVLTLETEGPCPQEPGKRIRMRDVTELKGHDHKVLTSSKLIEGKWMTAMTIDYRRR
jgi:hypothetical protein